MKTFLPRGGLHLVLVFGLLGAAGCGTSAPSRFYLLTPLAEPAADSSAEAPGPALSIGPVLVARYLDEPGIVVRPSQTELQYAAFHRWAEPLGDNMAAVLKENLARLLATERVILFHVGRAVNTDYQVAADITRFDGQPGESVTLDARWLVHRPDGRQPPMTRRLTLTEPVADKDFNSFVQAQSRLLQRLSEEIAEAIRAQEKAGEDRGDTGGEKPEEDADSKR